MGPHSTTFLLTKTVNKLLDQGPRFSPYPRVQVHQPVKKGKTRNGIETTMIDIDPHLTLYLGRDWDHLQIDGHTFIIMNDSNEIPVRKMEPDERVLIQPGHDRVTEEYWVFKGDNQNGR
jgi:hypothetical protein